MLFLGTDKYPEEGDFENFLTQHGGSSNAVRAVSFFSLTQECHIQQYSYIVVFFWSAILLLKSVFGCARYTASETLLVSCMFHGMFACRQIYIYIYQRSTVLSAS